MLHEKRKNYVLSGNWQFALSPGLIRLSFNKALTGDNAGKSVANCSK
jgi:hypothetical protein